MYNYDKTVLDLMQIPEALDRESFIDNLLMETAEMELLYNNVGFLKQAIGSWSKKNITVWNELFDTTQYEYNPIWNKDGKTIETETRDLAGTDHTTDNTDRIDNLQDKETRNLQDETLESVYGFNSSSDAPANKVKADYTGTDTNDHTGRQDVDRTFDKSTTDTGTIKHERTEQGNIGLTSTQQLIQEQREVVKLNLMDIIIKDFIQRFCIGVY
jgi:hypothetical protein